MKRIVGYLVRRIDIYHALEGIRRKPIIAIHILTCEGLIKLIALEDNARELFENVKKGTKLDIKYNELETWDALDKGSVVSSGKVESFTVIA